MQWHPQFVYMRAMSQEFHIAPDPDDARLSRPVTGIDQDGREVVQHVVHERPLTIFLNAQEVVTAMTIGDHPEWLAVGYLANQGMLSDADEITGIDHDEDLGVVVVRTAGETDFEEKMKKKVRTSGCAQGTVFGDIMETFEAIRLAPEATLRTSWLYSLMKQINTAPSLYLKAGAIHGCVLAERTAFWPISRTSGGTMRSTRSPAGCSSMA
jgi:FdhD protein